jgi:hypothetical protein
MLEIGPNLLQAIIALCGFATVASIMFFFYKVATED